MDIAGCAQPADEVGGDYYDVLTRHNTLYLGIGDVTGHGLESGVIMVMTQAMILALLEHGETDLIRCLNTLNRALYRNIARMGANKSLTFSLLKYQGKILQIVGQHEEVLVVRSNREIERVDTMDLGFQVGLVDDISKWVDTTTISLQPGDGVVLYTDGITEAENQDRELYGLERLCQSIRRHWDKAAQPLQHAVMQEVLDFIGTQHVYDDLTLVVLKQQ